MHQEEFLVAAIFRRGIQRRRVDDQPPIGIKHLDRAEMLGHGRMVEQDQMADRLANIIDFRRRHVGSDRAQRPIVKFDIAADIGINGGCKILERLARQLFLAPAYIQQDTGADRGEPDHRCHGGRDQQLRRHSPRLPAGGLEAAQSYPSVRSS